MNLEFIRPKFGGSTIALYIGILVSAASARHSEGSSRIGMFYIGYTVTLGSLAYRSFKKRKLGLVKSTLIRQFFEFFALAVIALPFSLLFFDPLRLFDAIADHPVNFIAPLWAFVAYFDLRRRKIPSDEKMN